MVFTNIQYLHTHSNKSSFVKILFSVIVAILILFIIQPIWLFNLSVNENNVKLMNLSSEYDSKNSKKLIKKEINWITTFISYIILVIFIFIKMN
jgi:hypothetical protein